MEEKKKKKKNIKKKTIISTDNQCRQCTGKNQPKNKQQNLHTLHRSILLDKRVNKKSKPKKGIGILVKLLEESSSDGGKNVVREASKDIT
jgi:hypothetical protein